MRDGDGASAAERPLLQWPHSVAEVRVARGRGSGRLAVQYTVSDLCVATGRRRTGIGARMLAFALRDPHARNALLFDAASECIVAPQVFASNTAAIALYRRHGFATLHRTIVTHPGAHRAETLLWMVAPVDRP